MADRAQSIKLYEELSNFQAEFSYSDRKTKEMLLEGVMDFLSGISGKLGKLSGDQEGQFGLEIAQGKMRHL